jgi:hypothetical protein
MAVIPNVYLVPQGAASATLGDVADRLSGALDRAGYQERPFLTTPGGFAIITRLERIDRDGSPRMQERFDVSVNRPNGIFSFGDYLHALLTANPGYYRVVVFVVTGTPVEQRAGGMPFGQVDMLFRSGSDILPPAVRNIRFDADAGYHCTALIYEFEHQDGQNPVQVTPGPQGQTQLQLSGVWPALQR